MDLGWVSEPARLIMTLDDRSVVDNEQAAERKIAQNTTKMMRK